MFPAWVCPSIRLVEWTRHIACLSYSVASHTVHSSGYRLQLVSQLAALTTSVIKMIQDRGNILSCAKLMNH